MTIDRTISFPIPRLDSNLASHAIAFMEVVPLDGQRSEIRQQITLALMAIIDGRDIIIDAVKDDG